MDLDGLLADPPGIHYDGTTVLGLEETVLRFLERTVKAGWRTLETGMGMSTLLFAILGTDHICIAPDPEQRDRLTKYARRHGIPLDRVDFRLDISERVLPTLSDLELDLVIVDGRHSFPTPFIDWYYAAPLLRSGGLMVIDDTQIWTGDVLHRFLAGEKEWTGRKRFLRTVVFEKIGEGSHTRWWDEQPFVEQRSRALWRRYGMRTMIRDLLGQIRRGEWSSLLKQIYRRLIGRS